MPTTWKFTWMNKIWKNKNKKLVRLELDGYDK